MARATEQIQYDTDDPNRIQDVGWTFKEVWRRIRGVVVTSVNLIIFLYCGSFLQPMETLILCFYQKHLQCFKNFG